MSLTNGKLVDSVIVTGGGQGQIAAALRMLKPNGTVANLEGMYEDVKAPTKLMLDVYEFECLPI